MDAPGQNMTGTSDYIDTNKILDLALAADPDLKTLGLIYNLGETNSVTTIENMKPVLEEKGITAVESTVTNAGEVQMAAQNLLAQGAEAIFVPIDNTVADGMAVLATTAIEAGVPVYTAADSLVRDGGLATTGVNYTKLGELTAQMAVDRRRLHRRGVTESTAGSALQRPRAPDARRAGGGSACLPAISIFA